MLRCSLIVLLQTCASVESAGIVDVSRGPLRICRLEDNILPPIVKAGIGREVYRKTEQNQGRGGEV